MKMNMIWTNCQITTMISMTSLEHKMKMKTTMMEILNPKQFNRILNKINQRKQPKMKMLKILTLTIIKVFMPRTIMVKSTSVLKPVLILSLRIYVKEFIKSSIKGSLLNLTCMDKAC